MIKMRTIKTALEEIYSNDPKSAMTENALRRIIAENKIPSIKRSGKIMFDMNKLEDYLSPPLPKEEPKYNMGIIRRVS